jgi:hypothetical protein
MENLASNDIGIGVELYNAVGFQDTNDSLNVNKLKEIADFFEGRPGGAWEIKSVVGKKTNQDIKNLDHLMTYVSLNKKKAELSGELDKLEKELKYYG